ncbi:MAG: phospholipase D family protein [Prevotellaceae bacterium]|jgi:phosphatidylserine/phosphatidylglycerophosphate/cardiolipin synthase-like enzyme|nr:phospholipase D family protein [Prevotellaceae bacterium]
MLEFKKNNVSCDIYVGTGAGTELVAAIGNAAESVDVVTPYISNDLVRKLIDVRNRGVKVRLITGNGDVGRRTNPRETREYFENARLLISQKRTEDSVARKRWEKLKRVSNYCFVASICVFLFLLVIGLHNFVPTLWWGILLLVALLLAAVVTGGFAEDVKVFSYEYEELFPVKVFKEYSSRGNIRDRVTTLHSKIYIIDNKVAYLGSVNFTKSGTKYNFETRIKVNDSAGVNAIKADVDRLFHDHSLVRNARFVENEYLKRWWQKVLYKAPINPGKLNSK